MNDFERYKLLGNYSTPRVRRGTILTCEARDCDLIVVAYSDARIPWPQGRKRGTSARSLVVYEGLAEAVKRESNQAVCYWFGITPQTVTKWRKALGIGAVNDGTHRLRSDWGHEPEILKGFDGSRKSAKIESRRRVAIAKAKLGKPRPKSVIEKLRQANIGRPLSDEHRATLSLSHRERGTRPPAAGVPWSSEEDELLRTLPAGEVVQQTGRTLTAIYHRRRVLGLCDGRRR